MGLREIITCGASHNSNRLGLSSGWGPGVVLSRRRPWRSMDWLEYFSQESPRFHGKIPMVFTRAVDFPDKSIDIEMLKVWSAKSTEDKSSRAACSAINLQNVSLLRVSSQCRVCINLRGWT